MQRANRMAQAYFVTTKRLQYRWYFRLVWTMDGWLLADHFEMIVEAGNRKAI